MPIKNIDPFENLIEKLDPNINPYVHRLKDHVSKGDLPIGYGPGLKRFVGQWRSEIRQLGQKEFGDAVTAQQLNLEEIAPRTQSPLILEVGCHQGHTLVEMARRHPLYQFIGIDITFKRVVSTGERLSKNGLKNAFCALANAQKMSVLFTPSELDGVVVFFPDPWTKKARQSKNRLFNGKFVQELQAALKPGGFVWFKSDQKVYADEVRDVLENAGFQVDALAQFPAIMNQDFSSTFERRFSEKNEPFYAIVAYKPLGH